MRATVLIAAAAFTLSACNNPDESAADADAYASTEAAEASGAAVDTAATTAGAAGAAGASGGADAARGARAASGETMDPASGGRVSDGAMAPGAQPGNTASNNVTETERRLNPPTAQ